MPAIIDKADGRKTVHDASDDMAKTGTNGAAAGRKTAHDASEARGETVRKDIAATNRDVTRKNAEGRGTDSPEGHGGPARHNGTLGGNGQRCRWREP